MTTHIIGDLPPFPEAAFTGVFATHRSLFGPTTAAPDAFHFAAMASALSFLVGRDTGLPSSTRPLFPNINVALIADTGEFKSTTLDDTREAVVGAFMPLPSAGGPPPKMFTFDGNGSGEGFLQAIADTEFTPAGAAAPQLITGRRGLLTIHELAEVLGKIKRDQAGNLLDVLLASFDARAQQTHITKGRTIRITNGLLVVQAASTFETLAQVLSASANTSGFMNRFAWFGGRPSRRLARRPPVDPLLLSKLLAELHHVMAAVLGKPMTLDGAADQRHDQWDAYHHGREASPALQQATKRANDQALKLAMLLAIASGRQTVMADDIDVGWKVMEYCRFFASLLIDKIPDAAFGGLEDRTFEMAKRLAAEGDGTFTQSAVFQRLKSKRLGWSEIDRAFKNVFKRGDFEPVQGSDKRFRIVSAPAPTPFIAFGSPPPPPGPYGTPTLAQPQPVFQHLGPFVPAPPLATPPKASAAIVPPLPFTPSLFSQGTPQDPNAK